MRPENTTEKTWRLVERYRTQEGIIERLAGQLSQEGAELDNVRRELGDWLTPDDAKDGEQFQIWIGDGIMAVKVISKGRRQFELSWRKKMVRTA